MITIFLIVLCCFLVLSMFGAEDGVEFVIASILLVLTISAGIDYSKEKNAYEQRIKILELRIAAIGENPDITP
jgi:hypothetical protein